MVFAHMDQLGFVVRKINDDGIIKVVRMGGVPERALLSQSVILYSKHKPYIEGIIYNKSHHITEPNEKYFVPKAAEISIDTGLRSKLEVEQHGIKIGSPVVYKPQSLEMKNDCIAGTSIDDRAGCAVLLELARHLKKRKNGPTVHIVFSVQEEFNLRGAMSAAHQVKPDIAIQIDLMLATDTPETHDYGEMELGKGPGMSLFSFHGRGTLNGVIPHPSLVDLMEQSADLKNIKLQRSAQVGVLTDLSYIQQLGNGVASIDMGFPMRNSHSSLEICNINDLVSLEVLLETALSNITSEFSLIRS
tara:strand:- start:425 stop:1333 length:909 start_codon:yes stop_codon:yes gene_type:complete